MGFEAKLTVSNALITMYAKCGSIEDACQMFNGMNGHDSVSWNAMVSAYIHGLGKKALMLFEEMEKDLHLMKLLYWLPFKLVVTLGYGKMYYGYSMKWDQIMGSGQ